MHCHLGLRKPPQVSQNSNYENYLLMQLKNFVDEQARRRFQQQRQQQQQNSMQNIESLTDEVSGPGFTYKLPIQYGSLSNDEPPFAIGPGHPNYYDKTDKPSGDNDPMLTYGRILSNDNDGPVRLSSDGIPSYKLKAPMNVNPKIVPYDEMLNNENDNSYEVSKSKDVLTRDDLKKLVENLERNGNGKAIVNLLQPTTQLQNEVDKKPVDLNSAWVIAVIAGVSAAFTVGLLAIGIGWYT